MEKTIYCLVIISMYGFENPLSLTFTFQLSLSLLLSPSTLTFTSTNIKLIKVIWVLDFTSAFGSYWSRQISTLESVQLCVFIVVHIYSIHCTLCRLPTVLYFYTFLAIYIFLFSWLGALFQNTADLERTNCIHFCEKQLTRTSIVFQIDAESKGQRKPVQLHVQVWVYKCVSKYAGIFKTHARKRFSIYFFGFL